MKSGSGGLLAGAHRAMGEATVSADARLLLQRELDERLGLSALIEQHLTDPRTGTRPPLSATGPLPPVQLQPPGGLRSQGRVIGKFVCWQPFC